MDNFAFELELLLKQTNDYEPPYTPGPPPVEPAYAPPVVETSAGYAGGLEAIGDDAAAAAAVAVNRRAPPFVEPFVFPAEGELGFTLMPDPFLPSAPVADSSPPQLLEYTSADLPAAAEANMFFASDPAPMDFVGLEPALPAQAQQVPQVDRHHPLQALFYQYRPAYLNPGGGGGAEDASFETNWEAIEWYLAGQVRPGPDVARIYKCGVCKLEFPNAQAYGGHMSSHSKTKKGGTRPAAARKGKQFKKTMNHHRPPKLARPRPPSPWPVLDPSSVTEANSLDDAKLKSKIARTSK